jgi:hypothetical protein
MLASWLDDDAAAEAVAVAKPVGFSLGMPG